jgi:hypothetical protein
MSVYKTLYMQNVFDHCYKIAYIYDLLEEKNPFLFTWFIIHGCHFYIYILFINVLPWHLWH